MGSQYIKFSFEQMKILNSKLKKYVDQYESSLERFEKSADILCDSWNGKACRAFKNSLPEIIRRYESMHRIFVEYCGFFDDITQKYEEAECTAESIARRLN